MVGVAAFSTDDVALVLREHPGLINTATDELRGSVVVAGEYAGQRVFGEAGLRLVGTLNGIPALFPDPRLVARVMRANGIRDAADVHCFADGRACVATPAELNRLFTRPPTLPQYVNCVALPFLFALLHFETYGSWPWGERSHGALGLLEGAGALRCEGHPVHGEVLKDVLSQCGVAEVLGLARRSADCPCGSGARFAKCHADAYREARSLRRMQMRQKHGEQ